MRIEGVGIEVGMKRWVHPQSALARFTVIV